VDIHVVQGERELAADNKTLGRFMLDGIPPSPRGVPQIEVSFDIDANGIVNVAAKDKATGKEQKITITASSGLSKEDIAKMTQDAEKHAEADKQKREQIDVKNQADSLVYASEKAVKDAGDKLEAGIKDEIELKIKAVKDVQGGDDLEALKKATEELSTTLSKIGENLYKQTGADSAGPASDADSGKQSTDAKDGDFSEDKDKPEGTDK